MISYIRNVFSLKKLTHKAVSIFAVWDSSSSFDRNSEIRRFAKLKNSKVGRYSRINPGCNLLNTTVGNFTAIGRDTSIGLGFHPLTYISTQNIFYKPSKMTNRWVKPITLEPRPISIGSDVWIGVEVMIMDGVTIGHGAVIGARAVVTKDVPPYAIAVGMPARVISYRFDEKIISRLLEVEWWNLPDDQIDKKINLFREKGLKIETIDEYFDQ